MDLPFAVEAIKGLFSRPSTAMYPAKPSTAAENYRGRIVFHPEKCINCMMCERVCSGNAITHTVEKTEEGERITRTFYLGSCTFCATCMDFCNDNAIEFTRDYHMIATREEDLMVSGTFIKKPPVRKPKPAAPAAPAAAAKPAAAAPAAKPEAEKQAPTAAPAKSTESAPAVKAEPEKAAVPAPAAAPAPAIEPRDDGKPVSDPSKCVYCGICAKKCPMQAITVDRVAKTWTLDEDACIACGTCAECCPKKCIIM